jgi:uncharacterized protein YigE (DUF2233 family)
MAALRSFTEASKNLAEAVHENCATATRSFGDYSVAAIEMTRSNIRFAMDLASGTGGSSISTLMSVSQEQSKRQLDALLAVQAGFWTLSQDLSTRTISPLLQAVNSAARG